MIFFLRHFITPFNNYELIALAFLNVNPIFLAYIILKSGRRAFSYLKLNHNLFSRGDVLSPLKFIDYNCATFKEYRSKAACFEAPHYYVRPHPDIVKLLWGACVPCTNSGGHALSTTYIFFGEIYDDCIPPLLLLRIDSILEFYDWTLASVVLNFDMFKWEKWCLLLLDISFPMYNGYKRQGKIIKDGIFILP